MIIFDIAEWIANFLILGIAIIMWSLGVFMIAMIVSMANEWLKQITQGEAND